MLIPCVKLDSSSATLYKVSTHAVFAQLPQVSLVQVSTKVQVFDHKTRRNRFSIPKSQLDDISNCSTPYREHVKLNPVELPRRSITSNYDCTMRNAFSRGTTSKCSKDEIEHQILLIIHTKRRLLLYGGTPKYKHVNE